MLTLEIAIQKIQQFPPEQRNKVIEYIEFLEFQATKGSRYPDELLNEPLGVKVKQPETPLEPIQEIENLALPDDEISAFDPEFAEMMEITDRGIKKYRNALIELAK